VGIVHENIVETAGISTKSLMMTKKECEYFLFDFIAPDLKSYAALQNYIGEELGLRTSCIITGCQPPRRELDA
jgi:hypothetical protein